MALLFMDGFDHTGTTSAILETKYALANVFGVVTTPVRTGSGAVTLYGTSYTLLTRPLAATGGFVIGVAVRRTATSSSIDWWQVRENATTHLTLAHDGAGHLQVKRGSTVLATGTAVIPLNSWVYIEFKGVIHDTAGSYEVRIDGVPQPELTASGVDTRNGGTTGQWDRVLLGGFDQTSTYYDDYYICDLSGPAPHNDFLGAVRVETLLPQTGNGSNTGLTPSTGTDHGALVDENPPNTTDYNGSPTVGAKDTYNYPSLALSGAILGIQTNLYVNKSDSTPRQVCAVVRAGGVDYDGASVSPLTSFSYFSELRALNPATGLAWTPADIAALEVGMKVTG